MNLAPRLLPLCLALALLPLPAPAPASECPDWELDRAREGALIAELQAAPDETAARGLNGALWKLWTQAPDAHAQDLLDSGMARMRMGDMRKAIAAFTALIDYCPDFAEGYNQRAFAHYLRQDFAPALADLDAALARSPRHVGALSGRALTLMGLGRDREALDALRAALALNPWLSERALLPVLEQRLGAQEL